MKRFGWRSRCPHVRIRGIWGDEIIFASPRYSRLQCLDCGRHLDGPVSLATHISINGGIFPADFYASKESEARNEQ
jgi:hypothetical protein